MKKLKALFGLCLIGLSLLVGTMPANASPESSLGQTLRSKGQKAKALSKKDIQRFVTAIAIIHHYYIKDVPNKTLFNNAIQGMVSNLDPHSTYLDAEALKELKTTVSGEFVGIGVELTTKDGFLKVISPLDGSPAQKAGLKPNDLIIKINGTLVRDLSLNDAIDRIKGKKGTKVNLTVIRKGMDKPLQVTVTRDTIKLVSVKSKILESGYAYIRITFFQGPVAKQLYDTIEKLKKESNGHLKGLVLDLRNNPGGLLDVSTEVADDFLDSKELRKYKGLIVYTKGRIAGSDISIKATPGEMIPGVPMVVLINGGSASASEIVAGALQDYKRAVVVGTRSFGKGSVQTVLPLDKDSAIKLTTALYYTPAGRVIQAEGIIPNVTVPAFSVKTPNTDFISLDEANFQHHITQGSDKAAKQKAAEARKKILQSQVKLAKEDYQLYEALLILKSLNAAKQ